MTVSAESERLVSVIIPVYGTASYVAATLDSVLKQTYRNYEIIVVNDGSPDSALLERVLDPYRTSIRYIVQENRGSSAARNTALKVARGFYVAILDSDDLWEPDYLQSQVGMLARYATIDVVYPDAIYFQLDGVKRRFSEDHPVGGDITFSRVLSRDCQIFGGVTGKREAFMRAGMYDENLRVGEDFDLWLRILKTGGRFAYNDRILVHYLERPGSLTSDRIGLTKRMVVVLDGIGKKLDLAPDEREILAGQKQRALASLSLAEGKAAILAGDPPTAILRLTAAFEQFGSWKLRAAVFSLRLAPRLLVTLYRLREWSDKALSRTFARIRT